MPRRQEAPTDYQRGLKYLAAAKKVTAIATSLDEREALPLRRAADGLTVRGLDLVMQGARALEAALRASRAEPHTEA